MNSLFSSEPPSKVMLLRTTYSILAIATLVVLSLSNTSRQIKALTLLSHNSIVDGWNRFPESSRSLDVALEKPPSCRCLHCAKDEDCGGLWMGALPEGQQHDPHLNATAAFDRITLVVSHCLQDLHWLNDFIEGVPIANITIYSKCGKDVLGAPPNSHIVRLPNVGRCDHTYAYHMAHALDDTSSPNKDKEVVLFLKDNREDWNLRQPGTYRSLKFMLRILQKRSFACGIHPGWKRFQHDNVPEKVLMSVYHATDVLKGFSMANYKSKDKHYRKFKTSSSFSSGYADFGGFMETVGYSLPSNLTEVCYGGSFAATLEGIQQQPQRVWQALEEALSRGNNIEEGHFAERSWAGLLSTPLPEYKIEALRDCSTEILRVNKSIRGALAIPKSEKLSKRTCLVGKRKTSGKPIRRVRKIANQTATARSRHLRKRDNKL